MTDMKIISEKLGWSALHTLGKGGGPRCIFLGETPLVTGHVCRIDGIEDCTVPARRFHLFHKAGGTIFEGGCLFPNGVSLEQTCRYFGNAVRLTYDVNWPKETWPKAPVELGSFSLPGRWTRMLVLERNASPAAWRDIKPGDSFSWETLPLSAVFMNEAGVKLETSLGFDLWRWDAALGMKQTVSASVEVTDEGVRFRRFIAPAGSEELFPERREYRFSAILAWSTPEMEKSDAPADAVPLPFCDKSDGVNLRELGPLPESPVLLLDAGKLCLPEKGRRLDASGSRTGLCLEEGGTLTALKRVVRQVAALSEKGTLAIRGIMPAVCLDGAHCLKKGAHPHWDLQALLTFVAWASNCLGDGWKLHIEYDEGPLKELPSLASLHAVSRCRKADGENEG